MKGIIYLFVACFCISYAFGLIEGVGNVTVGFWPLNESSGGAPDLNMWNLNRFDLDEVNGLVSSCAGPSVGYAGMSRCFNGSSSLAWLQTINDSLLFLDGSSSVSFWALYNGPLSGRNNLLGVNNGGFFIRNTEFGDGPANALKLSQNTNGTWAYPTNVTPLEEWRHYVFSWDEDEVSVYVNGLLNNTVSGFQPAYFSIPTFLRVGKHASSDLYHFNGSITDLLMLNMSVTADDVNELYNLGAFQFLEQSGSLNITLILVNSSFFGNVSFNGSNFVEDFNYSVAYQCPEGGNVDVLFFLNGSEVVRNSTMCNNATNVFNNTFVPSFEGDADVFITLNQSGSNQSASTVVESFMIDLSAPEVLFFDNIIPDVFSSSPSSMKGACNDSVLLQLEYNFTANGVQRLLENVSTSSNASAGYNHTNGVNVLSFVCRDLFKSSVVAYLNVTMSSGNFNLIDEYTGSVFNLDGIGSAILYHDSTNDFYDFKANDMTTVTFNTPFNDSKFRLAFNNTEADETINRFIDSSLLSNNINLCIDNGTFHNQQFTQSGVQRVFELRNVFANCWITADYTRFVLQNGFFLLSWTIAAPYEILTDINGQVQFISSLDGSVGSTINLDAIEFLETTRASTIVVDGLDVYHNSSGEFFVISYVNLDNDIDVGRLKVYRLDTDSLVINTGSFNPNNFSLNLDYSTLVNVSNVTSFRIEYNISRGGVSEVISRTFNMLGKVDLIKAPLAFVGGLLLLLVGLFTSTKAVTFSWFGPVCNLLAIAVLALAFGEWYINLMIVVNIIMFLFSSILSYNVYSRQVV